ncbi:MAG: lipopolysaccharide kinase InaA family protein, partial [Candidatus Brocadiales bacterium]
MQKILKKTTGSITWYIRESEVDILADKLSGLNDPIGGKNTAIHKKGRRKVFASLGTTTGGEEIYLKAFRLTSLPLRLKHLFSSSKAMRELTIGLTAIERGVPAIAPLAAGEKKHMGLLVECYVLLKKIDGAVNLRDYLDRDDVPRQQRSRVIEALGRLARKSHESGIFQTDFSLNNFLLEDPDDPSPRVCLIDFERTYVHDYLSNDMKNWTLAKLNRVGPGFSAADRLRFLKAYTAGSETDRPSRLRWMRELERHTYWILRKDALRMHSACVQGGRGYRSWTNGSLRAYCVEGRHSEEELIRLTKDMDKNAGKEEAVGTPGPFKVYKESGKIRSRDNWAEVDIYRFVPTGSQPAGTGPAVRAWQAANALIKANIPVNRVAGAIEVTEGAGGYLVVERVPGLKDLHAAIAESQPYPGKKRILLWHAARFLSRLHNHGTFAGPISNGDIGVLESPSGRTVGLYLTAPFRFKMSLVMSMSDTGPRDRESDLDGLQEFLGDLFEEGEAGLLRKFYRLHCS